MKKGWLALCFAVMMPSLAKAQSLEQVDACKSLRQEITAAGEEARALDSLLSSEVPLESYLSQLYEGIKILTKSGEMFFRAADSHETSCKASLTGNGEGMAALYEMYLEPIQKAHQFFKRGREAAISLKRQSDVDTFTQTMTEYETAVMKLVSACESDMAGLPQAERCKMLAVKLSNAMQGR